MKQTQKTAIEFNSLTPELRSQRQLAHDTCQHFNRAPSKGHLKKLKGLFASCGSQVIIESGFRCDYGHLISIGAKTYVNINCTLLDGGKITIGQDCLLGPNVQILTINHALSPQERLDKKSFAKDVVIGDNVWLGAGSLILPGVTIESGSVIGAGSVVTRNVPANFLYAGNPAKKIKRI